MPADTPISFAKPRTAGSVSSNDADRLERRGGDSAKRNRVAQNATVSVASYRDDPLYPKIERAVAAILENGKVVTPVAVLVGMDLLTPQRLDSWRCGRIPYLEQAIDCNLTRLSRLLRILRFHAHDLKLVPSISVYMRRGKKAQRLRFSKTGGVKLEEAYATHFVWPGKGPCHLPAPRQSTDELPCL